MIKIQPIEKNDKARTYRKKTFQLEPVEKSDETPTY